MSTFLSERVRRNAILIPYMSRHAMLHTRLKSTRGVRGRRRRWQSNFLAIEVYVTRRQLWRWHNRCRHDEGVLRMLCVSCYTSME